MGSTESIHVVIFGVEYLIKGDVDEEVTRQIARYVNAKMSEIHENTASRDHLKIAVLSALNIAGELFELRQQHEEDLRKLTDMENRIQTLTSKITESVT